MTRQLRTVSSFLSLLLFAHVSGLAPQPSAFESDIQVLERLAEERYAKGDLGRAAEIYQEIAAKQGDPGARAEALFTAAWLLELSDDRAQALDSLTRSLTLDLDQPFDASLYNRSFELLYQQALDLAVRERRDQAAAKTRQAVGEIEAERDPQARALLEQALSLDADNPSALYNLALLDLRSGDAPKALGDFERVVSLTYKETGSEMTRLRAKAMVGIGVIYHQEGRVDDAEQSFREAIRTDPDEATAWKNLGLLYVEQQQYDTASPALERAYELLPDDRDVLDALVRSLEASARLDRAADLLSTHLQKHARDTAVWLQLAVIEENRGEVAAALAAFETALRLDPGNRDGYASRAAAEIAQLHLAQQDLESALTVANQALGWDRENPEAWSALGRAQAAAGQLAQATASLTRAAELDPESLAHQLALGETLVASRQLAEAEAAFLRALTLDPESGEAATRLEAVRGQLAEQRAIAAGTSRPRKPIPPKKIGLEFAGIDYKDLQLRGALVKQVNKKSPAARAGLRKGDLILWVGEYSVLSDKDFFQYLKRNPPGESLDLEFLRDGRIHGTKITLR